MDLGIVEFIEEYCYPERNIILLQMTEKERLQHSIFLNVYIVVEQSSQIGMGAQGLHVLGSHVTPKPVPFVEH